MSYEAAWKQYKFIIHCCKIIYSFSYISKKIFSEKCNFCPQTLNSLEGVVEHYKNLRGVTVENPIFKKCIENASKDFVEPSTEKDNFCNKILYDSKTRSKHLLKRHLKLHKTPVKNLLIKKC